MRVNMKTVPQGNSEDKLERLLILDVKASPKLVRGLPLRSPLRSGEIVLLACAFNGSSVGVYFGGAALLLSIVASSVSSILRELRSRPKRRGR